MATPNYTAILANLTPEGFALQIAQAEHESNCPVDQVRDQPVCTCIVGAAADLLALSEWFRKNVRQLLINATGGPRPCTGCGADVYWIHHPATNRRAPYTAAGLNHFADCPNAGNFRGRSNA